MPDKVQKIALDAYVNRLAEFKESQQMIKFWKGRLERQQEELARIMGDFTIGTVNGEDVLFYEPIERFRGEDFKKDWPDMARLYTRAVEKKVLDTAWLREERPDLWRDYQVRSMRNTFEV